MNPRILLVEDDPNLGLIVQEHLQMNGFDVELWENGETGLAAFRRGRFALCLVDVMMPRLDGFAFAREVRRKDKLEGFRLGCDDYITKPFSVEELLLRIQAVLRRSGAGNADQPTSFTLGAYSFDSVTRTLCLGQQERRLTARESDLLKLLCLHQNKTLDRSLALREIWGEDSYFNARSMDVFVSKLRKYLKDDPRIEISSVHGVGFILTVRGK
jgi:DNA-binding response OmpR family regulator